MTAHVVVVDVDGKHVEGVKVALLIRGTGQEKTEDAQGQETGRQRHVGVLPVYHMLVLRSLCSVL